MFSQLRSAYRQLPISVLYQFLLVFSLSVYVMLDGLIGLATGMDVSAKELTFTGLRYFISWGIWVLLSPAVMVIIGEVFDSQTTSTWRRLGKILLWGLGCLIVHRFTSQLLGFELHRLSGWEYATRFWSLTNLKESAFMLFNSLIMLVIVGAFLFGMQYYRRYLDKEKELASAQLNALVMQLQPHFLFNTLNSISSLVDIDTKRAQTMLAQLGFLLRKMLDRSQPNQGLVTLQEEITFLKAYLGIEQVRFQDRLTISYDIAPDTESALVPYLIVQPLVENAIKHGVASLTESGTLHLCARRVQVGPESKLEVSVIDNGPGMEYYEVPTGPGVGLRNTTARLEQRYGGKAWLNLGAATNGKGLKASLMIPFQTP